MFTLDQIREMSREEKVAYLHRVTPDTLVRALLAYLPDTFLSDPEKLHTAILRLRANEEYRDLLDEFRPVRGLLFDYSPLLERVLKRLQIARLLAARNPDFTVFQTSSESREAIVKDASRVLNTDQIERLKKLAKELEATLKG